jgi:aminopeptidase N
MGFPCLTVKKELWTPSELQVDLEQRWFLSDGSGQTEEALWNIPLINSTSGTSGRNTEFSPFFASSREFSLKMPLAEASSWVKLNSNESALVRVSHSEEMITRLLPAISTKSLGAIDRAYLLDDQYALAVAGIAPLERIATLLAAYGGEDNNTVWKSLQAVFSGMKQGMETVSPEANAAFDSFCKKIVMKALSSVGWHHLPGEEDSRKEVRAIVISLAASFCADDTLVVEKARELFDAYMSSKDAAVLPSDFRGAVYRIVLLSGGQREFDTIMQQYNDATDDETKRSLTDFWF